MKIAVVGAGVAGLYAAWRLSSEHDVTLYEAADYPGGHTATVDVEHGGRTWAVDTGFIVFNDWTYPNFIAMLAELGVAWQPSDMSFSLRCERSGLEYNGTSLNSLFAQRRNLVRPSFLRMIADILRFNTRSRGIARHARRLADARRVPRPRRLFAAIRRALRRADGSGDLVRRGLDDARLPGPLLRRFLRPPRLPVGGRAPGLADGAGRLARVRARVARGRAHRAAARDTGGIDPAAARRRAHPHATRRRRWLRSRLPRLPFRPGAAPARGTDGRGNGSTARVPVRVERSHPAHRPAAAAEANAGPCRLELPPARGSAGAGGRHLRHERPAGARGAGAVPGHAEQSCRDRRAAGAAYASATTIPSTRRGRSPRSSGTGS